MTTLAEQAASMIRYTAWADERLLAAAEGLDDEQYQQICMPLAHMLGTQRWWYSRWTGGAWAEPELATLERAKQDYAGSHDTLLAYVSALTDEEWARAGQWWLEWGFEGRMPLGESITQLFCHGVQHRSELAVLLSEWGHSPGDLDYLIFLRDTSLPGIA